MMQRILVPLDGTPISEAALAPAISFARRFNSEILLVHIVKSHLFAGVIGGEDIRKDIQESEQYLARIAQGPVSSGVDVHYAVTAGKVKEQIIDQIRVNNPDLIMISSHERKDLTQILHPSTTWNILEHTDAPILALKYKKETFNVIQPNDLIPPFMKEATPILIPLNGSPLAEEAIPLAAGVAREFKNQIILIRIVESPVIFDDYVDYSKIEVREHELAMQEARRYLERTGKRIVDETGLKVAVTLGVGAPGEGILKYFKEHKVGLICISSYSRNLFERLATGSVTRHLLDRTDVPMLMKKIE